MTRLEPEDERMLHRYLDGEPVDRREVRARIEREPALRARFEELRDLRRCFEAGKDAPFRPSPGFTDKLMQVVRQRTLEQGWRDDDLETEESVRLCRRLLLAAVVLIGLVAIWGVGAFSRSSPGTVEASDELRKLDESVFGTGSWTPAVEPASGEKRR
ncbi:MAG: hypothetical protein Fur0037_01070 [Planctomycetota bacterium]